MDHPTEAWQPFETIPRNGREVFVLSSPDTPYPKLSVVHFRDGGWRDRSAYSHVHPVSERYLNGQSFGSVGQGRWAEISAIPARGALPDGGWQAMDSAPRNGEWFQWVYWITNVGNFGSYEEPRMSWIKRARFHAESDGYWMCPATSHADFSLKHGLWATQALPLLAPNLLTMNA